MNSTEACTFTFTSNIQCSAYTAGPINVSAPICWVQQIKFSKYISKEAATVTVIPNQHKCSYERTHSGWQAKRCCDWLDVQPHSYHQPVYMQQTFPFTLYRKKQNPDSSPPGRVERIQFDTMYFHLSPNLHLLK